MRVMKTILIMLDIKVRKYLWDGLILCCYGPFKVLEHALHFSFFFFQVILLGTLVLLWRLLHLSNSVLEHFKINLICFMPLNFTVEVNPIIVKLKLLSTSEELLTLSLLRVSILPLNCWQRWVTGFTTLL